MYLYAVKSFRFSWLPLGQTLPIFVMGLQCSPRSLSEQAEGAEHLAGFGTSSAHLCELHMDVGLDRVPPAALGVLTAGKAPSMWSLCSASSVCYIWYVFYAK